MNDVNKTLYIPLYGKALVSKKGVILKDEKAEYIWDKERFALKGKSKSKWLAYFMAMRSAVYDEWVIRQATENPDAAVLHIGCGMDGRIERLNIGNRKWYDIDFPEVITERKKYYTETEFYRMVSADMRSSGWESQISENQAAIVIIEGVSMYFKPEELTALLSSVRRHFSKVNLFMDCYSVRAAKISKHKNPINDVGVTTVYGYDEPKKIADECGLIFEAERSITPEKYINELRGFERTIFKHVFAGKFAKSMYRLYEFKSN